MLIQLKEKVQSLAQELGFAACGVSQASITPINQRALLDWLAAGHNAEMGWFNNHLAKRLNPQELEPDTVRVLSLRMDYLPPSTEPIKVLADKNLAYVSRYALGRDYHKLVRKRLAQLAKLIAAEIEASPELKATYPNFTARAFTDSAPVMEKALAQQAGLGWQAKNCLLLNPKVGSWHFLGELFINLPLPIDKPFSRNHCGSCTACHQACPTQAFVSDGLLDASKCISYLTIEYKGSIPLELRPLIGNRVFGCDDCQLVCPWNRFSPDTQEMDFYPRNGLENSSLLELFNWNEAEFTQATLGSSLKRVSYEQWLRNLAIGLGNAPASAEILASLKAKQSLSPLVQEAIAWAIEEQTKRQKAAGAAIID